MRVVAEQVELPRYDFSPVAFAAPFLRFVLAGSQPTFDVDLSALVRNCSHLSASRPKAAIRVPFRALLLSAVPIRETLGRREREFRLCLLKT